MSDSGTGGQILPFPVPAVSSDPVKKRVKKAQKTQSIGVLFPAYLTPEAALMAESMLQSTGGARLCLTLLTRNSHEWFQSVQRLGEADWQRLLSEVATFRSHMHYLQNLSYRVDECAKLVAAALEPNQQQTD